MCELTVIRFVVVLNRTQYCDMSYHGTFLAVKPMDCLLVLRLPALTLGVHKHDKMHGCVDHTVIYKYGNYSYGNLFQFVPLSIHIYNLTCM